VDHLAHFLQKSWRKFVEKVFSSRLCASWNRPI
jgi:hypothetical protein